VIRESKPLEWKGPHNLSATAPKTHGLPLRRSVGYAMSVTRPYRRTCRQFADGSYSKGGHWMYLLHPKYAKEPRHYVRAFLLIQQDVLDLFSYVEPCDANLSTYSHRIQQLLMRSCVEIEANFTAILFENKYSRATSCQNLNIGDYKLINLSHRLSAYQVRIPGWKGGAGIRRPFAPWLSDCPLPWYQAYNKSKHNRHENFHLATFDSMMDAFCGLNILLSAQFMSEEYGPNSKSLSISGAFNTYEGDDGMDPSIGELLRIKFPEDWPVEDRYEFTWPAISSQDDPFENFDYGAHA